MEDVFDAAWQAGPAASQGRIEAELGSLVDIYGQSLLDDPEQVRRLLLQSCPDALRHVMALVDAVQAGVPNRLHGAKDDAALSPLLHDSVRHLRERASLDDAWATWAVRTWAHALALPTIGLDDPDRAGPATIPSNITPQRALPFAAPEAAPADVVEATILVAPLFSEQDLQRIASDPQAIPGKPIVLRVAGAMTDESPEPASALPPLRHPPPEPTAPLAWERDDETRPRAKAPMLIGLVVIAGALALWFEGDVQRWFARPAPTVETPVTRIDVPTPASPPAAPKPETSTAVPPPAAEPATTESPPEAEATEPVREAAAEPAPAPARKDSRPTRRDTRSADAAPDPDGPCTPSTCGTVVGASELDTGADAGTYRIVVRMDDRETRVFTATFRLQAGSRVRSAGSRIVLTGR